MFAGQTYYFQVGGYDGDSGLLMFGLYDVGEAPAPKGEPLPTPTPPPGMM